MATPTLANTFVASNTISSSDVNENFSDIIDALTDGTSDLEVGTVDATGQVNGSVVTGATKAVGNSGATLTIDLSEGNIQTITLSANCTFTLSNPVSGGCYVLILTQDATGSREITWPSIEWVGGEEPSLTGDASSVDIVTLIYDGSTYYGNISLGYA